jgi:flagellar biosynthesis regulator FlaF
LSIEKYQNHTTLFIAFIPMLICLFLLSLWIYFKTKFVQHFYDTTLEDDILQDITLLHNQSDQTETEESIAQERSRAIDQILRSIRHLLRERQNDEMSEENIRIVRWLEQLQNQFENEQNISNGLPTELLSQLPTFKLTEKMKENEW